MRRKEVTLFPKVLALAILLAGLLASSFCPPVAKADSTHGSRLGLETRADGYPRRLKLLYNPYGSVNWSTYKQYKAQLHSHSSQSDGNKSPEGVIDAYNSANFKVLCITDHDGPTGVYSPGPTWPWTRWGRDPSAVGMVAIEGNELTQQGKHHITSLYGSVGSSSLTNEDAWLADIDNQDGLAYFCHPSWHVNCSLDAYRFAKSLSWYKGLLSNHPCLLGLEILSPVGSDLNGVAYNMKLWDDILMDMADSRGVWGFGSDDAHYYPSRVGFGWNVVIVNKLTDAKVRAAFESGQFYFSYRYSTGDTCPSMDSLVVDEANGTISVKANNYTSIQWICNGTVVSTGTTIRYVDNAYITKYVRVTLRNGTAWTCLQPITFTVDTATPTDPAEVPSDAADTTTPTDPTGTIPDKDVDTAPSSNPTGAPNWFFAVMVMTAGLLVSGICIVVTLRACKPRWFRGSW